MESGRLSPVHPHVKLLLPVWVQTPTHHLPPAEGREEREERESEGQELPTRLYLAPPLLPTQFEFAVRITESCQVISTISYFTSQHSYIGDMKQSHGTQFCINGSSLQSFSINWTDFLIQYFSKRCNTGRQTHHWCPYLGVCSPSGGGWSECCSTREWNEVLYYPAHHAIHGTRCYY